jgi:hypothetical protein
MFVINFKTTVTTVQPVNKSGESFSLTVGSDADPVFSEVGYTDDYR